MSEHYYTKNPETASQPSSFRTTLRGFELNFKTDNGVFSKNDIDFGSRLLIETFEEPLIDGSFLDVGTGYGPIGITLSKSFPQRKVYMVDINERAARLAEENAKVNGAKVNVRQSDLYENAEGPYAAILTNPPIRAGKKVVHEIFSKAYDYLMDKGELWVVIQKKQGAPSAVKALETRFEEVEIVVKKKGYFIIKAKKN
jgi:16S rRNA (guanine1207-N2)-methyltransferase